MACSPRGTVEDGVDTNETRRRRWTSGRRSSRKVTNGQDARRMQLVGKGTLFGAPSQEIGDPRDTWIEKREIKMGFLPRIPLKENGGASSKWSLSLGHLRVIEPSKTGDPWRCMIVRRNCVPKTSLYFNRATSTTIYVHHG